LQCTSEGDQLGPGGSCGCGCSVGGIVVVVMLMMLWLWLRCLWYRGCGVIDDVVVALVAALW
jgi:hypothetical protein